MKKIKIIFFMLILITFTCSCKKDKNIAEQVKKENSIPKQLIAIIENLDKTEIKLLEIKKDMEKSSDLEAEKDKEEMIKKIKKIKNPEENTTEVDRELNTVETHQEKLENKWISLEKLIEANHKQASNYKIIAVEEKAEEKNIKEFEDHLNNLTVYVSNKDFLNSFINNNAMYNDSGYFISLYKDYQAKIKKLKYYVNNIYIYALKDEWQLAFEGMSEVDSQYSEVLKQFNKDIKEKDKLSEEDKKKEKNLEALRLSIDSMKQCLANQDIQLLEIKRSILVANIEKVKE